MEAIFSPAAVRENGYPTSDGKPMAETEWHRILMTALIETLTIYYQQERFVHVSGNLLMFYEPGNKRRHVSPDVFVVRGVGKHRRPNYLIWEEGKAPDLVIELTSSSTRHEDTRRKFLLYQDTLRVKEYFLFDPRGDYLAPPLQGYRLRKGVYAAIRPRAGRLPSQVLRLHFEEHGEEVRLFNPATNQWLATAAEQAALDRAARQQAEVALQQAEATRQQSEAARQQVEVALQQSEAARQQAEAARQAAEAENERLRREVEDLRRQRPREP